MGTRKYISIVDESRNNIVIYNVPYNTTVSKLISSSMKYILVLAIIFIAMTQCIAQRTIEKGKQWNVFDSKAFSPSVCTDLYSFRKDTIINSYEYLELFRNTDTLTISEWQTTNLFLREDSLHRIYILANGNESLLYDFNLLENDTIQIEHEYPCELIVASVDSVELVSGEFRKRIRLISSIDPDPQQPWYGYKDWIQGIGSLSSLTYYTGSCFTDFSLSLLCYYENDDLVYTKPNNQGCFITPTKELIAQEEIEIYPNPVISYIHIKSEVKPEYLMIYTLSGRLVRESKSRSIDLSSVEAGVYIIQVILKDRIVTQKIIVN